MKQQETLHPFNEPGRRLKAAVVSYIAGYDGVDSTLERVPEDPGEQWAALAEMLIGQILKNPDVRKVLLEDDGARAVR